MLPAYQRLDTRELSGAHPDLGLIQEEQFAVLERMLEILIRRHECGVHVLVWHLAQPLQDRFELLDGDRLRNRAEHSQALHLREHAGGLEDTLVLDAHDRDGRFETEGAEGTNRLDPVPLRHPQVAEDQVEPRSRLRHGRERLAAVFSLGDVGDAQRTQHVANPRTHVQLVVDDQDTEQRIVVRYRTRACPAWSRTLTWHPEPPAPCAPAIPT